MFQTLATSINGSTVVPGARCAATPSALVGKQVKEVGRTLIKVGSDDVDGVTITFTDGTKAMAVTNLGGMAQSIKGGGLLQVEANGCQYTIK